MIVPTKIKYDWLSFIVNKISPIYIPQSTPIDDITPEYIIEQSSILSKDELLELIENYGEQEYDKGTRAVEFDSY